MVVAYASEGHHHLLHFVYVSFQCVALPSRNRSQWKRNLKFKWNFIVNLFELRVFFVRNAIVPFVTQFIGSEKSWSCISDISDSAIFPFGTIALSISRLKISWHPGAKWVHGAPLAIISKLMWKKGHQFWQRTSGGGIGAAPWVYPQFWVCEFVFLDECQKILLW